MFAYEYATWSLDICGEFRARHYYTGGFSHLRSSRNGERPGHEPRRVLCAVGSMPLLANFLACKSACNKKRPTHLRPSRLWQTAKGRANPLALGQGYVVKVQSAYNWHAIVG